MWRNKLLFSKERRADLLDSRTFISTTTTHGSYFKIETSARPSISRKCLDPLVSTELRCFVTIILVLRPILVSYRRSDKNSCSQWNAIAVYSGQIMISSPFKLFKAGFSPWRTHKCSVIYRPFHGKAAGSKVCWIQILSNSLGLVERSHT